MTNNDGTGSSGIMSTHKNCLLITIDSLRADYEELFYSNIFGESNDSITVFNAAFATGPGTSPSFPGILSGTLPLSRGGLGPLQEDRPRLANYLRNSGFSTGGFHCNPFLSRHFNYDEGYDEFQDYQNPLMGIATKIFPRGIEINNPKIARIDKYLHLTDAIKKSYQLIKGKPRPYVSAEVITDDTIDWLATIDEPFYCWTHFMDVHHPCYPPQEFRSQFNVTNMTQTEVSKLYSDLLGDPTTLSDEEIDKLRRLYSAAIRYVGDQIKRILTELDATGKYQDTLIIITSDHGELFGEHDQYGKPERMYDELLQVPMFVANGPEYLAEATDNLVSLIDIPPLIHNALNLDIPEEYEGRVPGIDEPREFIMAEHEVNGEVIVGARSRDWLYEGDEIRDEHRLFDLRNGIFENVSAKKYPHETAVIRNAVNHRLEQLNVETRELVEGLEGDVEDRLEDLGYL